MENKETMREDVKMATALSDQDCTQKASEFQNDKTFSCGYCNITVNSISCLKEHLQNNHEKKTNKGIKRIIQPAKCNICDKNYMGKSNLLAHMKSKHSEKILECDICKKIYKNTVSMINHKKYMHSETKTYKCNHCPWTFKWKGNLRNHVKIVHLKIKDFKCDSCSAEFAIAAKLRIHMKTVHEGVRNYQCDICPKKFKSKGNLNGHVLLVHSLKKKSKFQMQDL